MSDIKTKPVTKQYCDGWDRIFNKKVDNKSESEVRIFGVSEIRKHLKEAKNIIHFRKRSVGNKWL